MSRRTPRDVFVEDGGTEQASEIVEPRGSSSSTTTPRGSSSSSWRPCRGRPSSASSRHCESPASSAGSTGHAPWTYVAGPFLRFVCPSNFETSTTSEPIERAGAGVVYVHLEASRHNAHERAPMCRRHRCCGPRRLVPHRAPARQGYRVVAIVRGDPRARAESRARSRPYRADPADLADTEAILEALASHEPAELYNFASVSFGPDAWSDPVRTVELGRLAVARLLEGLRSAIAAPLPPGSSAWVFGRPPSLRRTSSALRSSRAVRRRESAGGLPDPGVSRAARPPRVLGCVLQPRVTAPPRGSSHGRSPWQRPRSRSGSRIVSFSRRRTRRDRGFAGDTCERRG